MILIFIQIRDGTHPLLVSLWLWKDNGPNMSVYTFCQLVKKSPIQNKTTFTFDGSLRNVRLDFFDEFPDPSHRLPCALWLAHHHASGANQFFLPLFSDHFLQICKFHGVTRCLIVYQQMRWCKPIFLQVLVTMFTTVLSNTPSEPKGLTALAIWILGSLILVFIALVLYVVILVSLMRLARKTKSELPGFSEENNHVDFDSAFLLAHPILFAIFVVVYALAVFVWNGCNCLTSFFLTNLLSYPQ